VTRNISATMTDRGVFSVDHIQETTGCECDGHVTDDVTWSQTVKVAAGIALQWDRYLVPQNVYLVLVTICIVYYFRWLCDARIIPWGSTANGNLTKRDLEIPTETSGSVRLWIITSL